MNEYDDFITTAQVAATVLDELSSHTTILHDALKELPELLENTPPEEKMLWKNIGRFSTTGS